MITSRGIKRLANKIALGLFIISIIVLLKYSYLPNVLHLPFMERPQNDSGIVMSIASSMLVTSVFYYIMNWLPEIIQQREEQEESIPKRVVVHREICRFANQLIQLWEKIISAARDDDVTILEPSTIEAVFRDETIRKSASVIRLHEESNYYNILNQHPKWGDLICLKNQELSRIADTILDRYGGDIPPNVAYDISYLQKESGIGDSLITMIHHIMQLGERFPQAPLLSCIPTKDGELFLEETSDVVKDLCEWICREQADLAHNLEGNHPDRVAHLTKPIQ